MIPVFITARLKSERLPRKHFLLLDDHTTVIEHVVRRCLHFSLKPILCVPEEDEDEFNAETDIVDIFGGHADNIEQRLIECAHHHGISAFHHLDGDDPFFDEWAVIDSYNCCADPHTKLSRVFPSYQSQAGSGRVGTSYNLSSGATMTRNLSDRGEHHVWPQRLTLDYEEDYHLIMAVNRMCGGFMAPRLAVDELFIKNPDLHRINWFRTAEWKQRQRHERPST